MERIGPYTLFKGSGPRLTGDTLALTEFLPPLRSTDAVIDLGTGTGAIPLILAWKTPVEKIVGVEAEASFAGIARRNVLENGLSSRVSVLEEDFRNLPEVFPGGSFSVVVSNPPYNRAGSGRLSSRGERNAARYETRGTLRDLVQVSAYLAGKGGSVFYVFTARRHDEMMAELEGAGLCPARLEFVENAEEAKVFLVEARGPD